MEKKEYQQPTISVIYFDEADVLTASGSVTPQYSVEESDYYHQFFY